MKGYNEMDSLKAMGLFFIFVIVWMFIQAQYGSFQIVFSQQNVVNNLMHQIDVLNAQLKEKCLACPEVRCIGDFTMPAALIGAFFGFILGALFAMDAAKRLKRLYENAVKKEREARKPAVRDKI